MIAVSREIRTFESAFREQLVALGSATVQRAFAFVRLWGIVAAKTGSVIFQVAFVSFDLVYMSRNRTQGEIGATLFLLMTRCAIVFGVVKGLPLLILVAFCIQGCLLLQPWIDIGLSLEDRALHLLFGALLISLYAPLVDLSWIIPCLACCREAFNVPDQRN